MEDFALARRPTTHILPSKLTANLCDLSRSTRESTINRTSSHIIAFRRVRSRFVALNRTYSRNMACARSRWAPKGKGPFGRFQQPLDSQTKHASATPPRGRTVNGDTGVEPPLGGGANRLHVPFPALVSFGVLKEGKASAAQRTKAALSGSSLWMILDGAGKIDISLCPVMSFPTHPVTVRTGVGYRKDGGWLPLRRGLVVTPLSRAARSPTCPSRTLVASTLGLPARREPAALCGGAS